MWYILSALLLATPSFSKNWEFLDPTKLQTVKSAHIQERAALEIIRAYMRRATVEVNPQWFKNKKDLFYLKTSGGFLHIKASTGVAAVWGFNYYLKKYCKCQIGWQTKNVRIPRPIPEVDEYVVASDRFRYYQNVYTASYSFVWWNIDNWRKHLKWMALNGINLTLAPVDQEAIWVRVYKQMGMSQKDIEKHFTGPAFLSWLRLGNLRGWGGPLLNSWHALQRNIQNTMINSMLNLGMVPVLPAFNGHVPVPFSRLFPDIKFHRVKPWNDFNIDNCCGLFVDPFDQMFKVIGANFLNEMGKVNGCHVYISNPFNEVHLPSFNTSYTTKTAENIFITLSAFDDKVVWMTQSKIFSLPPNDLPWPKKRVKSFLNVVPKGRLLILDLQAEKSPKYDTYNMYFGQPFIWCMQHNYGGTLGMFGNMVTINKNVYEVRKRPNGTMIGIGITPEGINQNYVVYDLMLEAGWRKAPVKNLEAWAASYAERRYGCSTTAEAWKYLLQSVYSYKGFGKVDGLCTVTRKPSFDYRPWAWYNSSSLFEALKRLVFVNNSKCDTKGYRYDVVDVTRQALQYRIDQLYMKLVSDRDTYKFNSTVTKFLEAFDDMAQILGADVHFRAAKWFSSARAIGRNEHEANLYEQNAWNQITRWGPSDAVNDIACKQWSEMVSYYYKPGWANFLSDYIKNKNMETGERMVRYIVTENSHVSSKPTLRGDVYNRQEKKPYDLAKYLYKKWVSVQGLYDLRIERGAGGGGGKLVQNVEPSVDPLHDYDI